MGLIQDWFKYKQQTELSYVEKQAQDSSMNLNMEVNRLLGFS